MAAIVTHSLTKAYGTRSALAGVDLEVAEGEVLALLGPNGAGKTTLLEILEGLRLADGGTALVLGRDPATRAGRRYVQERIGVSLQTTALFDTLTVLETLDLFGSFYTRRAPSSELLDQIGLADRATARVGALSGGQRQRVALALALVNRPELIFLDEPTTGLDPVARRYVWESIRAISAQGRTIVLTTHYMEEATQLARHVAIMDSGRIVSEGTPEGIVATLGLGVTVRVAPLSLALDTVFWPGVGVERDVDVWRITAERPEPIIDRVFAQARQLGVEVTRLEVERATLEDAFILLTGRGLE